jgi:hypothetical protein
MANITLNPGSGGSTVATDVHGGDNYQLVKVAGNKAGTWPGYTGPSDTFPAPVQVDDDGALITRSAVLTDEGTFRCNFANTSLWVGIGSVTGTGFLAADVHLNDYFKVSADADTVAQQIASIDSNTQLTLKANYSGSASGTGQRAIMLPVAGTGGSTAVASGQLTITAGTTATSQTGVKRFVDYGPLVYRARGNISQRIANQSLRAGLREDVATPRWFAWFLLDGTTNTTVKCQTARNPTGAPSAAETQETTVTLPNGATTATAREWRIELLTETVRFYVDTVLVAEHSTTIPHQHDEMAAVYEFVNGTTPATSTTAVVDFCTGKNHNKLEIGVMSDAEKIVASQPPLTTSNYSQAGVIAINTVLMQLDCRSIRGISLHITSLGTTGQITPQWSNDGTTWVTASMMSAASGTQTQLFTLTGMFTCHVAGRFFRLQLTSATTAGTTTLVLLGYEWPIGPVNSTTISGSVTIGTNAALVAGTAAIGDVGVQYRANATGGASFVSVLSPATPAATVCKASAGRLLGLQLQNSAAAIRSVKFWNTAQGSVTLGTTAALFEVDIPAGGRAEFNLEGGIAFSTAITYAVTGAKGLTDNTGALGANDVSGSLFFA